MSSLHSEDPESVTSTSNINDVGGANMMSSADRERDLERKTLGKNENRAVFWSRILVIVVLCTTAAMVVTFVYKSLSSSQEESFEEAFESDSLKIMDSFHRSIERMMDSCDALSISYTSHALSSNSTFPNVTLPNYQLVTANARIMSEAVVFNYHPLITDETRKGWEAYVVENRIQFNLSTASEYGWIALQDAQYNQSNGRNLLEIQGFQDEIGNLGPDGLVHPAPQGSGPYIPIWQMSPFTPIPVLINFNTLTHPASPYHIETLKGQAIISPTANLNNEFSGESGAYFRLVLTLSQFRETGSQYWSDPQSPFSYPVFDSFDPLTRTVAGIISSTFYWRVYLENILPTNHNGIFCVIQNTFNQTFTYRIDGSNATYMGAGDLHDTKYDYLKVSSDMASYLALHASVKTKSYTIVPLNSEFNSYSLTIYPSQDTEDEHVNNEPAVMALTIVCVFLFTSCVFLMYDRYVARRQRVVMDRAVASSAIVSSLFPSQVRDNIYRENEAKQKHGFTTSTDMDQDSEEMKEGNAAFSKPNAVLFPETTVMFADMAGFTSWSSTRGPVEVFELLEAVYQAFDVIAARRRVFKVETIGDCYVAVAGLPNPQPDHALIMTKFAEDCISKIRQVTAKLAPSLGEDTTKLMIRVGLHSGPVTGGVLRGEKARFQLFGDTMNTASRMETNGEVGKIHASDATAQALINKGKTHWLDSRDDKIEVKGKGALHTYWVSTRMSGSSGPRSSAASSNMSENDQMIQEVPSLLGIDGETEEFVNATIVGPTNPRISFEI